MPFWCNGFLATDAQNLVAKSNLLIVCEDEGELLNFQSLLSSRRETYFLCCTQKITLYFLALLYFPFLENKTWQNYSKKTFLLTRGCQNCPFSCSS